MLKLPYDSMRPNALADLDNASLWLRLAALRPSLPSSSSAAPLGPGIPLLEPGKIELPGTHRLQSRVFSAHMSAVSIVVAVTQHLKNQPEPFRETVHGHPRSPWEDNNRKCSDRVIK
jgi:hypothetical protein